MRTILVVDDEDEIRQLVARMLRHGGFQVLEAESGAQAAKVYSKASVDLLVTDVLMPTESGLELAERLRQVEPELKVLYMSGSPLQDDTYQSETFLPKPFTIAELCGSVNALLMH